MVTAPLNRAFYARSADVVARELLGCHLAHRVDHQWRVGRIVETEAYLGPHDLACHSAKGRTARTEVMFGPPGISYVYLIYGLHHCFNAVTGDGAAVLIRALEPLTLLPSATNGPGRLTKALGLTRQHNALPLDGPTLRLTAGAPVEASAVRTSARIGVEYAKAWAKAPLRFFIRNHGSVSTPRHLKTTSQRK
jgi:DNA-3-methyladenine glycosylase